MCGIAGILQFDGAPPDEDLLRRMTRVLAHRGPDAEGLHVAGPVGLGHRRLAILDLSPAAQQPLSNEDGSLWLTYNGEIYNFAELRAELTAAGHVFRSRTDSEVVVHAYEQWGVECLSRFNGMFAFGLWDSRRRHLWLVRDRLGIKPLFYACLPGRFLFGSEIKALLSCPQLGRQLDYQALAYYLALNWIPAPHTLFAAVRQLLPGHWLLVTPDGAVTDTQYWELQYQEPAPQSERAWREQFDAAMADAVRLRLVSDVPFGAFLSGGLDSSSIAWWMTQGLSAPLHTFTVAFPGTSYDEGPYARHVAQALGTVHHEQPVTPELATLLPKLVWHAEEPTADSSMLAVYYLAQETRKHVTMALSGDGGDELLAGYETYQAYYLAHCYRLIPGALRRHLVAPLVNSLPASARKMSLEMRLKRFVAGAEYPPEDAHALWRIIFGAAERARLLAPIWREPGVQSDVVDLYREWLARSTARHPLDRLLWVDTRLYLPNDMLVKLDRMTMAHGLEARVPFLDYRVVELVAAMPPEYKLRHFHCKKYILKAVMRGRLPPRTLARPKAGFNIPLAQWLRHDLRDFVQDALSPAAVRDLGILDPGVVAQLLDEHFRGADHSHQLWGLLTLALWWRTFQQTAPANP